MPKERTDQPSDVTTQEAPRPRDADVVTSDVGFTPEPKPGPGEAGSGEQAAAGDDKKPSAPTSDAATGDPKPAPSTRNRSAEARIRKLSRKLADAKARDQENTRRIAELEQAVDSITTAAGQSPEPQLQDFANPREYAKAYAKWEKAQPPAGRSTPPPRGRTRTATTPPATPTPASAAPASAAPGANAPPATAPPPDQEIVDFQARGKEKLGDEFVEALRDDVPCNQLMGEYLIDSDVGPEVYVHLANNPDEASRIYNYSTPRALKALAALEKKAAKGELDVGAEGELQVAPAPTGGQPAQQTPAAGASPAPARTTKAPSPPSDVKDGGDARIEPDPENESMDEYAARRKREELRKAGVVT